MTLKYVNTIMGATFNEPFFFTATGEWRMENTDFRCCSCKVRLLFDPLQYNYILAFSCIHCALPANVYCVSDSKKLKRIFIPIYYEQNVLSTIVEFDSSLLNIDKYPTNREIVEF